MQKIMEAFSQISYFMKTFKIAETYWKNATAY